MLQFPPGPARVSAHCCNSFLRSFPLPGWAGGLWRQQPDSAAVLNWKGLGTSTTIFYITESCLSPLDGPGLGFSLECPTVSLHAVGVQGPRCIAIEHLYVMVNAEFEEESKGSTAFHRKKDADDDVGFRFVPSDISVLEATFTAMCERQALHPHPEDEDSDDYDGEHNVMAVDAAPTVARQFEDADLITGNDFLLFLDSAYNYRRELDKDPFINELYKSVTLFDFKLFFSKIKQYITNISSIIFNYDTSSYIYEEFCSQTRK
ncbi:LOW QUALITY PROTEIN: methylosome subunit pICln-like [Rousettus aegyptiacus]|uniref:LOW QUALITY PROTEIN: methylosome subunit pICln-like n=1 Tax=Rousettus aegyptiacus TaxID=9407 RepID=UPI00168D70C6|nr:LOW QUALITY PROTEIN: methylosome subunit pICln-like [Rousettus aegyptiacus]